jgi:5'-methylthioadenosine phosphorylase
VAHVGFAHPFCGPLSRVLHTAAADTGATVHMGGTYVCMEGPQFSTIAESNAYRSAGFDVIGMTNLQEAKLAREAEICYATLALVTDYDCWHPDHASVTVEMVVANMQANARRAQQAIAAAVEALPIARDCECASALATAILTRRDAIPAATRERLRPIVGRYLES